MVIHLSSTSHTVTYPFVAFVLLLFWSFFLSRVCACTPTWILHLKFLHFVVVVGLVFYLSFVFAAVFVFPQSVSQALLCLLTI